MVSFKFVDRTPINLPFTYLEREDVKSVRISITEQCKKCKTNNTRHYVLDRLRNTSYLEDKEGTHDYCEGCGNKIFSDHTKS